MTIISTRRQIVRGNGRALRTVFPSDELVLWGLTYDTIPELEAAIIATPELFYDGTPVYVTEITYDTPLADDPVTTDGWVIMYDLKPYPLLIPSDDHLQYWIDSYGLPDGGLSWVGEGTEGSFLEPTTVVGGGPSPTSTTVATGICAGQTSANELDTPLHPSSLISGDPIDYSDWDLPNVGTTT